MQDLKAVQLVVAPWDNKDDGTRNYSLYALSKEGFVYVKHSPKKPWLRVNMTIADEKEEFEYAPATEPPPIDPYDFVGLDPETL